VHDAAQTDWLTPLGRHQGGGDSVGKQTAVLDAKCRLRVDTVDKLFFSSEGETLIQEHGPHRNNDSSLAAVGF
jgi:hypothetical protein